MRITGADRHIARLRRMAGPEMVRKVTAALYAGGQMIEIDAEISITAGSVSGKNHTPSRPGEAPNADTRTLDTNIETIVDGDLRVTVTSNADHSIPLEFGTSNMQARPFMGPAAAKNRAGVTELVMRAVDSVTRGR